LGTVPGVSTQVVRHVRLHTGDQGLVGRVAGVGGLGGSQRRRQGHVDHLVAAGGTRGGDEWGFVMRPRRYKARENTQTGLCARTRVCVLSPASDR
ncbi:MAG: hypothetical protein ACK55Z_19430, partial [bacterium]